MRAPTAGALRLVRCAALAALVVSLSVLAHLCGGGQVPPAPTTALLVLPLTVCAWGAARWRWTTGRLLLALGAGQAALHGALEAATASGGHPMAMGTGASVPVLADLGLTTPMLAFHLAATVVSALAVAGAESALWRLWRWLQPRTAPALPPLGAPAGVEDVVLGPVGAAPPHVAHVRRRGPPALLARP